MEPMEPTKQPLATVQSLRLSFFTDAGEVKALNDVSLQLDAGKVLGVVGESGSGKSVTAYSLMGIIPSPGRILSGSVQFAGHNITALSEKQLQKIRGKEESIIFQDPLTSLNPVYTIGNQIREAILLHTNATKKQATQRAVQLLQLVGIDNAPARLKQYPYQLSGGQQQRVMIAMALACEPKLLIADEATTALDVTIQAQILELLARLKDQLGMSILLITHDLGIVSSLCDDIAVLYGGRVVEHGTTDEIFYDPQHEYTKGLLKSIPTLVEDRHDRLVPIEGAPPDMLHPPAGCPFSPRCTACMRVCIQRMPPATRLSPTHHSACWLLQKQAADATATPAPKGGGV